MASRVTEVRTLWDAGFGVPPFVRGKPCWCGHDAGEHILIATSGRPLDGGVWRCQERLSMAKCSCQGTWSTDAPEELKARQ